MLALLVVFILLALAVVPLAARSAVGSGFIEPDVAGKCAGDAARIGHTEDQDRGEVRDREGRAEGAGRRAGRSMRTEGPVGILRMLPILRAVPIVPAGL